MAVEIILIRPARGDIVHATRMGSDRLNTTLCGRRCRGWLVDEGPLNCSRCLKMQRDQKLNRTINQDPSGHWRTKIGKLADRLGFSRFELWRHWSQIALTVEFESGLPRAIAEHSAYGLTEAMVDKAGAVPS